MFEQFFWFCLYEPRHIIGYSWELDAVAVERQNRAKHCAGAIVIQEEQDKASQTIFMRG